MSETTPQTNERPILVPRGQKPGENPADRKVEVWTLTNMVAENGKRIVRSQVAEQLGDNYGIVEKTISEKTLSDEGQNALAREYSGKDLIDDPSTEKRANDERLQRTQELIHEGVADRGEAVLHAAGIEAPISPEDQAETLQREIKKVETEITDMTENLSESDKRAMWQYATALYPAESDGAQRKLSFKFEENYPGRLSAYKAAYQRLHELRVQAGILDK